MEHSYSIDNRIYNSEKLSRTNSTGYKNGTDEEESNLARRIEEELGIAGSTNYDSDDYESTKLSFVKKIMEQLLKLKISENISKLKISENLSKLKIPEKVAFLKEYLQIKSEFEYSDSSIDEFEDEPAKETDLFDSYEQSTTAYNSTEVSSLEVTSPKSKKMSRAERAREAKAAKLSARSERSRESKSAKSSARSEKSSDSKSRKSSSRSEKSSEGKSSKSLTRSEKAREAKAVKLSARSEKSRESKSPKLSIRSEKSIIEISQKSVSSINSITSKPADSSRSADHSSLDPATLENVFLLFVDTTHKLALKAVENNQHVLTDRLLCNLFRRLKEVYEDNYTNDYSNSLDSRGGHPLYHVYFNIPLKTPPSLRDQVEKLGREKVFKNAVSEKVYMFQFLEKFKLMDLHKICLNYSHPLVNELWNLCLDSVVNKRTHDWDKIFYCRNNIFQKRSKSFDDKSSTDDQKSIDEVTHYSTEATIMSKFHSDHDLMEMAQYMSKIDRLPKDDTFANTSEKDMWIKEVYIPNSQVLSYIFHSNRLLSNDRIDYFKAHFNLKDTNLTDTWIRDQNNILPTYCSIEKKGVCIKVRGKLPCDITTALSIISDSELATEWVPFSRDSRDIKVFTKTSRIFKQVYDYPMIGYKETIFHGLSTNLLDEANCVVICCSNPPASSKEAEHVFSSFKKAGIEGSDYLSVDSKTNFSILGYPVSKIQKKNQKSGDILFILFPYSEKETLMEAYGNIIQEVKIVPMKFVIFIAKKMIMGMFKKVSSICKNFKDSKFAFSVKERSNFCMWLDHLYKEYKMNNPQSFVYDKENSTYTYSLRRARRRVRPL